MKKQKAAAEAIFQPVLNSSIEVSQERDAVLVLVAGERHCVEAGLEAVRSLFPCRKLVLICEPVHRPWLKLLTDENVFVVDQPFNPFGPIASEIRTKLAHTRFEACVLIVAAFGFESVRLRGFALRLAVQSFVLIHGDEQGFLKRVSRWGFLRSAVRAFVRGQLRKLQDRVFSYAHKAGGHGFCPLAGFETVLAPFVRWNLDRKYERVLRDLVVEQKDSSFDPGSQSRESLNFIIGTLGPGGSERQLVTTVLGLVGCGYRNIDVVCASLNTPIERFYAHLLEEQSVSISELNQGFRLDDEYKALRAAEEPGLKVVLEKLPPELKDVVRYVREFRVRRPKIIHSWLDNTNVKAGLAGLISGVPRIILSTRSMAPNNFALFQPYMRAAYRILAQHEGVCFLNNSKAGARDYEHWLGLPAGTFKVIHNAIELTALEPVLKNRLGLRFRERLSIPENVPVVGSVFRFSEEKCPLTWIKVAEQIAEQRKDVKFLLVGDGPLRGEVLQYARLKGLGDRLFMPGHQKDVLMAIAAMDTFLLTSRLEGLPNVLIEAQGLGVPVVTTKVGGAGEALLHGKTGYAVARQSVEALADAVLKILADRQRLSQIRIAGPQFIREQFSVMQMVERTLDAYFKRGEFQLSDEALPISALKAVI